MKIEVMKSDSRTKQPWHWHFNNKGKITAAGEGHDSRSKSIRAAKGVVRAVCKVLSMDIYFRTVIKDDVTTITW